MPLEPLGPGWAPLLERALGALRGEGFHGLEATGGGSDGKTNPALLSALGLYLDEVVRWNQRTDLTAARTPEELVDLTLADAFVVASSSAAEGKWIDVGSGAGAPGLVAALLLPSIHMTLVEPRDRRVAFLRSLMGRLGLSRVSVERSRSDRLPAAGWDVALSRATLPPPRWLEEGARLARAVWVLLAREEAPLCPGLAIARDLHYTWPLTGVPRRAVRYAPVDPAAAAS